jgi:ribonuclease HI
MLQNVELFCDGACLGNPGPGGWAYLLRTKTSNGPAERTGCGANASTTNNQMELRAAIEGLSALNRPCAVKLFCDSRYVVQGINEWLKGWKQKGWRKADNSPVLNAELWQTLDGLLGIHRVEALWVKGHAGHTENERVDKLAREQASRLAGEFGKNKH